MISDSDDRIGVVMKIMCDVCNKRESTVFFAADEAALCDRCDERVHCTNNLASKHNRHALSRTSSQGSPLCDICQERRGLFFCREERAILCRECDLRVHTTNEYTKNHNRFLLTGIRISPSTSLSQASSSSSHGLKDAASSVERHNNRVTLPSQLPVKTEIQTSSEYMDYATGQMNFQENHLNASCSISEYFTKTLPGWRVDDFLDPHPPQFNSYCKTLHDVFPIS